jgi:DNA-binding response OmpR family regulator
MNCIAIQQLFYLITLSIYIMLKTVLLVDDDEDEYCIFKMALEMTNNESTCMWADNLNDAIKILQVHQPEMVFIDINMPKHDGFTCLEELKKIDPISHSAFIMYSTHISENDHNRALRTGACCCVNKGQNLQVLKKQLSILFNGNLSYHQ